MEGKAVFGGGQGKGGEADNKLNIDSIIARLLEGDLINKLHIVFLNFHLPTTFAVLSFAVHLWLDNYPIFNVQ